MKRSVIGICLLVATSGCATGPFEWRYGQDKIVPGQFSMNSTDKNGTVLTWPSHAVAAIVYPNGDTACIQSAQSAKARNSTGQGDVSVALTSGERIGGSVGQAIKEAVASLQDRNDVATFLDVALFQICTISRNKNLDSAQTIGLVERALAAAEAIAKARPLTDRTPQSAITPADATLPQKPPQSAPAGTLVPIGT